eukprot:2269443-Pyramimonas_sp.AAC.1
MQAALTLTHSAGLMRWGVAAGHWGRPWGARVSPPMGTTALTVAEHPGHCTDTARPPAASSVRSIATCEAERKARPLSKFTATTEKTHRP